MNARACPLGLTITSGTKAADVAPDTVAVKCVLDQMEILENLVVHIELAASARRRGSAGWCNEVVVVSEAGASPPISNVEQLSVAPPIVGAFDDDVGMEVGNGRIDGRARRRGAAAAVVELGGEKICGPIRR